ncbi:GreA/GreB family elongation factor [Paenibacillus sp. N3.4]|uniref:GreA/GreB family elongation factor n=1 Tax=Paenibacillus sp. N3.4 TaxID=2603222 RepID=UPI0011CC0473|nr:GreA/GreB family elongation factor [Paenibacillus sp. N3.4]TXK83732.1 GreA/GreB family elongation factor [Paenibacillus sp. N3.4]
MNHSFMHQDAKSRLVDQLTYFDEEKINFLHQYLPEHNQKRRLVEKTLSDYSFFLKKLINNLNEEDLNARALIGSELELRFLEDDCSETFTIVFPHHADPGRNRISFLSPIGFQLLMTQSNQTYQLDIPSGEMSVKVEGIKFVHCDDKNENE